MSTELAYLVGVARRDAWAPPAGSELAYKRQTLGTVESPSQNAPTIRPPPPMSSYIGAAVTLDTSAQANFTDHEYQKNWQARNYERASIEALNSRDAHRSAEHFMQRLAVGVRPRVRHLHDRIIAGRAQERVQYIMQDEPTYFTWDGTDPTLAMWSASASATEAWARGLPMEAGYRPVRESARQSQGPF
jgi:hypothetical protein